MKTTVTQKADKINLLSLRTPNMRAFHISWFTFFICFFGWFGIAPLMAIIREELHLTKSQIGNIMIASVSITIFARLIIGWLCDKIGPRLTYTSVLFFGSIPIFLIGLTNSYETFLACRLAIGFIGASFVITQYHTSVMFSSKIVGTANATTAGWGNLGGGITQMVMPLIFAGFVGMGYSNALAWRYSMAIPGVAMLIMGVIYYFFTQDTPEGNILELKKKKPIEKTVIKIKENSLVSVISDYRVWILFLVYGACFGMEITINNIAVIYYVDNFKLDINSAGAVAGLYGLMNIFARTLGGAASDKISLKYGMQGRAFLLGILLVGESIGIMLFSKSGDLSFAILSMIIFAIFVQMSNGATFSIVPFINKKAIGLVAGIVGAGGIVGAVFASMLMGSENISYRSGLWMISLVVAGVSVLAYFLKNPTPEIEVIPSKNTIAEVEVILSKKDTSGELAGASTK